MGFVGSKMDGGDGIVVSNEEWVTEGVVVACNQGLHDMLELDLISWRGRTYGCEGWPQRPSHRPEAILVAARIPSYDSISIYYKVTRFDLE